MYDKSCSVFRVNRGQQLAISLSLFTRDFTSSGVARIPKFIKVLKNCYKMTRVGIGLGRQWQYFGVL